MRKLLPLCLMVFLAGCAFMGVPTASTFNQRLAAAYSTATAVTKTELLLVQGGKLSKTDAVKISDSIDSAVGTLDIARLTFASTPVAAEDNLTTAIAALSAIQTLLEARK